MHVAHLRASNWRNFQHIEVDLCERQFVVGANASGKSNFLDLFRFLRDVARPEGGGLQKAVKDRGGVSKLRSLAARRDPSVMIDVTLSDGADSETLWRYRLAFQQETRGFRQPLVSCEQVWKDDNLILDRPNEDDRADRDRRTQTFLEQVNENSSFRDVVKFFQSVTYLHLVPQLLRYVDSIQGRVIETDPFGQGFLERVARTSPKTQRSRLARIEKALKVAVPQLEQLKFDRDRDTGRPHLAALYSHWRPNAGWQREDQFSDGTLRLIGLLWSLLEGDSLLLLEEPELSLNSAIVEKVGPIIHTMQRQRRRQVIVSTHSADLLSDPGIDAREVVLLEPGSEGTAARTAASIADAAALMRSGLPAGEAVLPRTRPARTEMLSELA